MRYESVDPATGRLVAWYPIATDAEVERALDRAWGAFWRGRHDEPSSRVAAVRRLGELFEKAAPELAALAAREMGKPVTDGEAEARKCALLCRWAAEEGPALLAPERRPGEAREAWVRHEPLGPVLALMPWNYPFWQVVRFAAPAMLAGNTVLLKHAPCTPDCARRLEALFREAGFPPGSFQSLFLDEAQAARLIADPRVRALTLTGSTRAGRTVAALAGRALKPCVLELGSSDPFLVFSDAPLAEVAAAAVAARCQNAGQSCIAAKRLLVERSVYEPFLEAVGAGMRARRVGPPTDPATQMGPLARRDLRDGLGAQVASLVAAGARVRLGGVVPDGPGWWYPATVLTDLAPDVPAAQEELFGPVAVVTPFRDEAEALALANGTAYGLGAAVWTADAARAARMAAGLEVGTVAVNGIVKSDPRLPFGGVKDSGWGRELGREGLCAFTNAKSVSIR